MRWDWTLNPPVTWLSNTVELYKNLLQIFFLQFLPTAFKVLTVLAEPSGSPLSLPSLQQFCELLYCKGMWISRLSRVKLIHAWCTQNPPHIHLFGAEKEMGTKTGVLGFSQGKQVSVKGLFCLPESWNVGRQRHAGTKAPTKPMTWRHVRDLEKMAR